MSSVQIDWYKDELRLIRKRPIICKHIDRLTQEKLMSYRDVGGLIQKRPISYSS